MRFDRFEIRNYKGIAKASLSDLAALPVVTISGRNGTGKSLILEALVGAWAQRYQLSDRIGPWGDEMYIEYTLHLTPEEWDRVDAWHVRFNGGGPAPRTDNLTYQIRSMKSGTSQNVKDTAVLQILRNQMFQREQPFGAIDFLPASRMIPNVPSPTVDLGMLNIERVEQERYSVLDQVIRDRAPMSLPSVSSYLVTLDYQAFLASRQNLDVTNDYELLRDSFYAATGKNLLLPEYDPVRGSTLEAQLPSGQRHGLADLSSGEKEMLAVMYFVRRLSAAGGVLCIDEPEQHLHPTLQAAVFDSMQDLASRAQVLVVTHSVNLIAAAPPESLAQMGPPMADGDNQLTRLADAPAKVALVSELGITPGDLFQHDALLIVEGDTDSQWLRALFPVELGRTYVIVAGGAARVIDAHETLEKFPTGIPWICVRDKDLLSDDDVAKLLARYHQLHVWPSRAIESLLLDPALIAAVLVSVGRDTTTAEVLGWLQEGASPLKNDVLAILVERELSRLFPAPEAPESGNRFQKMEGQLRAYSDVNALRADNVERVVASQREELDSRWPTEWQTLVDPKPLFEIVTQRVGAFSTSDNLRAALVARARTDLSLRPPALEELRSKLAALTARPRAS